MKKWMIFGIVVLFGIKSFGQNENPKYDSTLAFALGADQLGMRLYVMAILKTGDNTSTDKNYRDSCFTGHLKNIQRLAAEKKLVVAGPFVKNNAQLRGIFILNATNLEEAKQLIESDPAINEGFLSPELYLWYGSAALPEYMEAAEKIWRVKP
ncbi:MAG: hypothetical protein IPM48_07350 [Saprospiraceae bacterium]|nr:hypothetical protein [Saprospiraceae bacterium]